MKTRTLWVLSFAILSFISCTKDPGTDPPAETQETYMNTSSKTSWQYFSLTENKMVGSGEENEIENQKWAERTDWDIAIRRYEIRTNSGEFSKTNAKGGVYIYETAKMDGEVYVYDEKIPFSSVVDLPAGIVFRTDKAITSSGMGGETTIIRSEAEVIKFKMKWDDVSKKWSKEMPPVYLKAPLCIFRTADGNHHYKIEFTQYINDAGETGHVKFNAAQI